MVLFPVVWDRAAAAAAELCSNFTGNPVVNLDYRVAPALKEKPETEGLPIRVRDDHRNLQRSRAKSIATLLVLSPAKFFAQFRIGTQ